MPWCLDTARTRTVSIPRSHILFTVFLTPSTRETSDGPKPHNPLILLALSLLLAGSVGVARASDLGPWHCFCGTIVPQMELSTFVADPNGPPRMTWFISDRTGT